MKRDKNQGLYVFGVGISTLAIWLFLYAAVDLIFHHEQSWHWTLLTVLVAPLFAVWLNDRLLGGSPFLHAVLGGVVAAMIVVIPWMLVTDFQNNVVMASLVLLFTWPLIAGITAGMRPVRAEPLQSE